MKKRIVFSVLLFCTCTAFPAGKKLSTTITLGYDSRYVLYGYRQNHPLYHADIYLSRPLTDQITLRGGSWAGALSTGEYQEVDFYGGADVHLGGGVYAGLTYSYFRYIEAPWGAGDAHEIAGHVTWYTGPFSFGFHDLYDTEGEGHLARAIATYSRPLTETIGLSLHAECGYSFDYYAAGNGPNHALLRAELPVQLTGSVSIAPFIAQSLALDKIDGFENDQLYGGVSLVASF